MKNLPKSFEELGIEMPDLGAIPEEFRKRITAEIKLMYLCKHLNGDWVADINDITQMKFYPLFYVGGEAEDGAGEGFGYVISVFGATDVDSGIGLCLSYKSADLAKYAGKTFIDIYTDFITG